MQNGTRMYGMIGLGVLAVVLLGGCPCPCDCPAPDPAALDAWEAGLYWVECEKCELAATLLPRWRGDELVAMGVVTGEPDWYAGPAVYARGEDGQWIQATAVGETLDDFLQLYDPLPRVPSD